MDDETSLGDLARRFPPEFIFGTATSSYQIEGAVEEDGRKPSIWDAFAHTPGRIRNNDTGDVACDHYHRYKEDMALAAGLGVDAYRFSVSWPRIMPDGEGEVNGKGLDFYDRLVDTILAQGMKPHLTLHHWDLPIGLSGWGGWTARRTAYALADFSTVVMRRLGDRLATVATINEPWCVSILSYLIGLHAPGERNMAAALASVHTVNLGHGLCVDAVRAECPSLPVGIVLNSEAIHPASERPEDIAAARRRDLFHNGLFCEPLFKGRYPDEVMEALAADFPKIEPGDLAIISRPIDFLGLNYYQPAYIEDAPGESYPSANWRPPAPGARTSAMNWLIEPSGLGHLIRQLGAKYDLPPIYIMENGGAFNDVLENGVVEDQDRIAYFRDHLIEVAHLIESGVDIRGYFAWSLMDNYEWSAGYACRFGLIHVDFETQKRTLKASGAWFRDLLSRRRR